MPKPRTKQYRTKNWKAYNAGLKSRGSLSIWVDKEMAWFAGCAGKCGRSPIYNDAAIQFCLLLKCLFGIPLRQSMGLVESQLKLAGLAWTVPDFSTISRRQKHLQVKANFFQGRDGYFYSSFFNISIGIERLLKLAVITHYMLTNGRDSPVPS